MNRRHFLSAILALPAAISNSPHTHHWYTHPDMSDPLGMIICCDCGQRRIEVDPSFISEPVQLTSVNGITIHTVSLIFSPAKM